MSSSSRRRAGRPTSPSSDAGSSAPSSPTSSVASSSSAASARSTRSAEQSSLSVDKKEGGADARAPRGPAGKSATGAAHGDDESSGYESPASSSDASSRASTAGKRLIPKGTAKQKQQPHESAGVSWQEAMHPWLGMRARLSRSWATLSLMPLATYATLLVMMWFYLDDALSDAAEIIEASCSGLDTVSSYVASSPHYLATGTNAKLADEINDVIEGSLSIIDLAFEAAEGVASFVITAVIAPMVCLMDFIIAASLKVLQEALAIVDEAIQKIGSGITDVVEDALSGINKAIDEANSINPCEKRQRRGIFDDIGDVVDDVVDDVGDAVCDAIPTIPRISVDLSAIEDIHLDLQSSLDGLSEQVPTTDEATAALKKLVLDPLKAAHKEVTQLTNEAKINSSIFPVPKKEVISLCSKPSQDTLSNMAYWLNMAIYIAAAIIGLVFLAMFAVNALRTWWEYRMMLDTIETSKADFFHDSGPPSTAELLAFYEACESPATTFAVATYSERDPRKGWLASYLTKSAVVTFFMLGIFGVLIVLIQLVIISAWLRTQAADTANDIFSNISDSLQSEINGRIEDSTGIYVKDVNAEVAAFQENWDKHVAKGVLTLTDTLNDTIADAYGSVTKTITEIFGTGPYANNVQGLVQCVVGTKVVLIERALTWIHEHVALSFPNMTDEQPFAMSEEESQAVVDAIGGGDTKSSLEQAIISFLDQYERSLIESLWIFGFYLALVAVAVAMGVTGYMHGGNVDDGSLARRDRRDDEHHADRVARREKAPRPSSESSYSSASSAHEMKTLAPRRSR